MVVYIKMSDNITMVRTFLIVVGAVLSLYFSGQVNAEDLTKEHKGAKVFLTYCAGCHGFEGKASYDPAPSFSLGERLKKDDRELLESVLKGLNGMPSWEDKLPLESLKNAIAYIRLMHKRTMEGLPARQQEIPETYYRFKPTGEELTPESKDK